jgi:hypothetical protein
VRKLFLVLLVISIWGCAPEECTQVVIGRVVSSSKSSLTKKSSTTQSSAENPWILINPINVMAGGWWYNVSAFSGDGTSAYPYYASSYMELHEDAIVNGNLKFNAAILIVIGDIIGSGIITVGEGSYIRCTGSIDNRITIHGDASGNYVKSLVEVEHREGCNSIETVPLKIWDFELASHEAHCDNEGTLSNDGPQPSGAPTTFVVSCSQTVPGYIVVEGRTYYITEK